MVIAHFWAHFIGECDALLLRRDFPKFLHQVSGLEHGILLDGKPGIFAADHVQQHGGCVLMRRRILSISLSKMLGPEEVNVALGRRIENILFTIEKNKIRSDTNADFLDQMAHFHKQRNPGAPVVRADKRLCPFTAVEFLVSNGSCVVMGTENDSALTLGMP